jgi:hypothetical protein
MSTTSTLHLGPRWIELVRIQLSSILSTLRERGSLIRLGLLLFLSTLVAAQDGLPGIMSDAQGVTFGFYRPEELLASPGTFGLFCAFCGSLLVGLFWPLRVWRACQPSRRDYFWSLPAGRWRHETARVVAGGLALCLIVALLLGLALLFSSLAGSAATLPNLPVPVWIGFLLGPWLLYALSSIAALLGNRPGLWILSAMGAIYVLVIFCLVQGDAPLGELSRRALDGPYSLYVTLAGPFLNETTRPHYELPTSSWFAAAGLWIGLTTIGLLLSAGRGRK